MADNSVQIAARQWVDSLERKWRLQILSKTYRLDKDGNRIERPTRIRRFVEGMPIACAQEALNYLLSKAPYKGLVYNGVEIDGEYIPSRTIWQRDDQAVVNGNQKTDGTYTLIQDLVDKRLWDRYSVGSAESCSEEVLTDWVWDAPFIEELPVTGSLQGVSWAIQSVSRNEDGTFNYAIVKRVAKTVHTPRLLSKSSASETVEVETWDNLYGESPSFTDHSGNAVTVPTASVLNGGRTEIVITKNDDCTYKVQASYITEVYADETAGGAVSCSEETEYEYRWGDADIEDLASSQGVTQAIQNLRRNDNGTFDYTIVTRTAKTQDSGKLIQSDTVTEKVEVQTWDNVYGSIGAWVDDSNTALAIPASTAGGNIRIDLDISKNADCTYKVKATWTTRKALVSAASSSHTQYEGEHTETKEGAAFPLGNAPDAAAGVIKDYESQRQPDGSYKLVEKVKVERPVPESTKQISVGRRGRRVTVVNTNQLNPADATTVAIGGSVKSEKTPGKRYTNTITTWETTNPVRAAESCTEDILHHQHSGTTSGIASMPTANEHVYGSGVGGLVVRRQTDMDEEGSISQTVTNDQEKQVNDYEEVWTVGLTGITKKTTHRQVAATDTAHLGTIPTYSKLKVGQTLRRVKTPGGLTDVEITEIDRTSGSLKSGTGCSKTAFLHTDSSSENDPSGSLEDTHVPAANDGIYYETETRLNADGSTTHTTRTNEEVEERNAEVSYRRNAKGLITTIKHRNVDDEISPPDADHAGDAVSKEMTNGKLYNITSVSLTPSILPDHAACQKTIFEHSHDNVTMGSGAVDTSDVAEAGNGIYHQKTSDMDADGFVRTTDRTITELPVTDSEAQYKADRFTKVTRVTQKNQNNPTITAPDFLGDDEHAVTTVIARKNPGGTLDVTTETEQKQFHSWEHTVDDNWLYERTIWFQNATAAEKDELYSEAKETFDDKFDDWKKNFLTTGNNATSAGGISGNFEVNAGYRMPVTYSITPNISQNSNGLYDGSFKFTARWDMDSAGQRGTLNANYCWWSYTDRAIQMSPNASSSGSASMTTTTIDRHVYCAVGRGLALLSKLMCDSSVYFSGTHMDFNPVTQVWHVNLVNSCDIRITGTGT